MFPRPLVTDEVLEDRVFAGCCRQRQLTVMLL